MRDALVNPGKIVAYVALGVNFLLKGMLPFSANLIVVLSGSVTLGPSNDCLFNNISLSRSR